MTDEEWLEFIAAAIESAHSIGSARYFIAARVLMMIEEAGYGIRPLDSAHAHRPIP